MLRFTRWFPPRRGGTRAAFILPFRVIWSGTDGGTSTGRGSREAFTAGAVEENASMLGLTLRGAMVASVPVVVIFQRARMRRLPVGNPASSTPLLFKEEWGFLLCLLCVLYDILLCAFMRRFYK